jgi:2-iminobutanoate/2-iminopropanoate deaminase
MEREVLMSKQAVSTEAAPKAVGPYSQGIILNEGKLVFVSGQTPSDPATSKLVEGDIAAQTRRCLENVRAVLAAAGSAPDKVVKTTVFLTDMADFKAMNAVYAEFFGQTPPARSTIAVVGLPLGARIEIEAIASL